MSSGKRLSKLLTLAFFITAPAWGQVLIQTKNPQKTNSYLDFVRESEAKTRQSQALPIQIPKDKILPTKDFEDQIKKLSSSGGGWNGTGGGGGLACFESFEVLNKLDPYLQPGLDLLKSPRVIPYIVDFMVMDVADSVISINHSIKEDFSQVIERNIRKRIGHTLPWMAEYLIHTYQQTRKLPLNKVSFLNFKADVGASVVNGLQKIPCVYGQWILRLQNRSDANPQFGLYVNEDLDRHLRKILPSANYNVQKEIILLHEAIYGLFMHTSGVGHSQTTRVLVQNIVADDASFSQILGTQNQARYSSAFWNFWIQRNLVMNRKAINHYHGYLQKLGTSGEVLKRLSDYSEFLKFLDLAPFEEFADSVNKSFPGIVLSLPRMSDPDDEQFALFVKFLLANSVALLERDSKNPLESSGVFSFYLIAHELHSKNKLPSPELWLTEIPYESASYRFVCSEAQKILQQPKSPIETLGMIQEYFKRNVHNALNYCRSEKVSFN